MVEILHRLVAPVDTGTLAANAPIDIHSLISNGVVRNFIIKNAVSFIHAQFPDVTDPCMLLLVDADASDAEITAAYVSTPQDLEDGVAYRIGQTTVRRIWAAAILEVRAIINGGETTQMVQWKLPPKGIPVLKGNGIKMVAINMDTSAAFTNGPTITAWSKVMGGWF